MAAVDDAFSAAAEDRERGAGEIERRLLERLARAGSLEAGPLRAGAHRLGEGQPVMANLQRIATAARELEPADFADWVAARLERLDHLPEALGAAAWPWLEDAATVVTVSRSSAVTWCLAYARRQGWRGSVVVLDGAPSGGGPDQSRRLAEIGLAVRSLPDAMGPHCLGPAAVVVTGADAVGARRFVNATGTTLLLEAAARRGVDRLVVADRAKDAAEELVERMLASGPVAGDDHRRRWPILEACATGLVTARCHDDGCDRPAADGLPVRLEP